MSPATVASRSPHRELLTATAILALAVLVAYANSLAVPFVFDDEPAIVQNHTLHALRSAWSPPVNGSPVTGRPLLNVSFALNHRFGGLDPRGYHATNLAIHFAATLTLFGLVRRTLHAPLAPSGTREHAGALAFVLALFWALHPLQTAAVTYVSQRSESLAGLFVLLTLYAFARGTSSPRRHRWHALACLAGLAGVATKEIAAVAPLLALFWDRTFFSGTLRAAWRRHRSSHLALLATWIPLVVLVLGAPGRGGTAGPGAGIPITEYLLTQAGAILHYVRLAFWPHPLVFDYGTATTPWTGMTALSVFGILLLLAATVWALRHRPRWAFAGCWFFATLAPSSSIVPVATQTIAEHRMYLPLAAVLGGLVMASARWAARPAWWVAATLVALVLGAVTFTRNSDYATAENLWRNTVDRRGENARAHHNLGQAIMKAGRPTEAATSFANALRLEPGHTKALDGLSSARLATGDVTGAVEAVTQAVQLDPDFVAARVNLGAALAQAGRTEEAIREFREALRREPEAPDANLNLGLLLLDRNQPAAAIPFLQRATNDVNAPRGARSSLAEAHHQLGLAHARAGRLAEAKEHLEETARLQPEAAMARANLGNVCLQTGDAAAATTHYEAALRLDPQLSGVRDNLALARQMRATPSR